MLRGLQRAFTTVSLLGLLLLAPAATASVSASCSSVSYTFPGTHNEGHAALNAIQTLHLSCATARSLAHAFLATGKPPHGWQAKEQTVRIRVQGRENTVSEELLTRGSERVTGEVAN